MKRLEWTVEGQRVHGRFYTPPGTTVQRYPVVVMIHGLSSSSVEFYDFPQKVADQGYAVLTFDYRGHGESEGDRGFLSRQRVLEDILAGIETLEREPHADLARVALLGHSAGGALALSAAPHIPNLVCVVALAPLARARDEMNPFEYAGYNLMRVLNVPARLFYKPGLRVPYKVDYARLYSTAAAVERARKDDFLQATLPVKLYRPFVRDLNGVAAAENVHLPTLVLVAEYDIVVGKYNSRRVFDALPGPKKWVEVPKSGHSMMGDARSDFVVTHVTEFLQTHLKGVPAV